jgi:hypothetical protein
MNYKYALGKKFIDPQDIRSARLDLATIDTEALHAIADAMVRSQDFTPGDGDMIAKVARIIYRVKNDLDVTDLKGFQNEYSKIK